MTHHVISLSLSLSHIHTHTHYTWMARHPMSFTGNFELPKVVFQHLLLNVTMLGSTITILGLKRLLEKQKGGGREGGEKERERKR